MNGALASTAALWVWLLLACAIAYLTKLAGYLMPARWLRSARMTRVAGALTIALLAALTVLNTASAGAQLALDARVVALAAAALALWARLPFLAVVLLGAAAAALARALGWG